MNVDVTAQQRGVGDHDVIAQPAIVGHVAIGHQVVMTADGSETVLFFRGAIDGHAFADGVVIADRDAGIAAAIAQILGLGADDHIRIDVVVFADRRPGP